MSIVSRLWREIQEQVRDTQEWEWKAWALVWVPFVLIFVLAWLFNAMDASARPGDWAQIFLSMSNGQTYKVEGQGGLSADHDPTDRVLLWNVNRQFIIGTPVAVGAPNSFNLRFPMTMGLANGALHDERVQIQIQDAAGIFHYNSSQTYTIKAYPVPSKAWSVKCKLASNGSSVISFDEYVSSQRVMCIGTSPSGHGSDDRLALIKAGNDKAKPVPGTFLTTIPIGTSWTIYFTILKQNVSHGDMLNAYIYENGSNYVTAVSTSMAVKVY